MPDKKAKPAKKIKGPKKPPTDPAKYDEAVKWFRARVPMTDEAFDALVLAEREHAFVVANVTQANTVQTIYNAIDTALVKGTTFAEFKKAVVPALKEEMTGPTQAQLETVFSTNVMSATNAGRYAVFDDPEVKAARPYLRNDAIGDSRTCPSCMPLDGVVLPADDKFWRTHSKPLHPRCRCIDTALSQEEARDEGITVEIPEALPPAPGFGKRPVLEDPGASWTPDLSGLDPAVRDELERRLK